MECGGLSSRSSPSYSGLPALNLVAASLLPTRVPRNGTCAVGSLPRRVLDSRVGLFGWQAALGSALRKPGDDVFAVWRLFVLLVWFSETALRKGNSFRGRTMTDVFRSCLAWFLSFPKSPSLKPETRPKGQPLDSNINTGLESRPFLECRAFQLQNTSLRFVFLKHQSICP